MFLFDYSPGRAPHSPTGRVPPARDALRLARGLAGNLPAGRALRLLQAAWRIRAVQQLLTNVNAAQDGRRRFSGYSFSDCNNGPKTGFLSATRVRCFGGGTITEGTYESEYAVGLDRLRNKSAPFVHTIALLDTVFPTPVNRTGTYVRDLLAPSLLPIAPMEIPIPKRGATWARVAGMIATHPDLNPNLRRKANRGQPEKVPLRIARPDFMGPGSATIDPRLGISIDLSPSLDTYRDKEGKPEPSLYFPVARRQETGVKERKKYSRVRAIGVAAFKALDKISEAAEVVDAFFQALPEDMVKALKKANPERPADTIGQYGVGGADWKLEALYKNWDQVNMDAALKNLLKNEMEDRMYGMAYGALDGLRPRNLMATKERRQNPRRRVR